MSLDKKISVFDMMAQQHHTRLVVLSAFCEKCFLDILSPRS